MLQLIIGVFMLLIGFSSYRIAKRQGQWSWIKFFAAIAAALAVPILVIMPLTTARWLKDKPGLATLIMVGLIFLFVGALVYVMRKFPRSAKNSGS